MVQANPKTVYHVTMGWWNNSKHSFLHQKPYMEITTARNKWTSCGILLSQTQESLQHSCHRTEHTYTHLFHKIYVTEVELFHVIISLNFLKNSTLYKMLLIQNTTFATDWTSVWKIISVC
jgi:hypothetical protein